MNRMKKTLCLLLAVFMVMALVPTFVFTAMAEDGDPTPVTKYVIYQQSFDDLGSDLTYAELADALNWVVPESKAHKALPAYSLVANGQGSALRVNTLGLSGDSFINILGGDVMSVVRNGNFTLSYDLIYREGTTNFDGYSSVIYNYNEKDGMLVSEDGAESYGIVAVRPCGAGFNGVYYPVNDTSVFCLIEDVQNSGEYVMSNRYVGQGDRLSLYGKLFDSDEAEDTVLFGKNMLQDKTLSVRMEYKYNEGVYVYINDVLVSVPNAVNNYGVINNTNVWSDFLSRSTASTLALLTAQGIVADIDNIKVEAERPASLVGTNGMPELLITEIAASPDDSWAEYIEIYNPTDKPVDFSKYSILMAENVASGSVNDTIFGYNSLKKYALQVKLSDLVGSNLISTKAAYMTEEELALIEGYYVYADEELYTAEGELPDPESGETGTHRKIYCKALQSSTAFYKTARDLERIPGRFVYANGVMYTSAGQLPEEGVEGTHRKIYYIERWNTRYEIGGEQYNTNTMLNPGETMLLYTMLDRTENCWTKGVNAGRDTVAISGADSFRKLYSKYGLEADVKVVALNQFNLANTVNNRYYIARSEDDEGNPLSYKGQYLIDKNYSQHIVSFVQYCTPIATGNLYEGADPTSSDFGKGGNVMGGYSAVYVYGVDASNDPRQGTLYASHNKIKAGKTSHVGGLSGYQQILLCEMYRDYDEGLPKLMITEMVARTSNMEGEDKTAFSAMEITNTGNRTVDLYQYALVRTGLDIGLLRDDGFMYSTSIQAGCPVTRTASNGAYYFFAANKLSNPDTCYIQPGESVVVWFITEGTFSSYANDEGFGFDYFRQYWSNNGSPQMAMKTSAGEYETKVVAVDANIAPLSNAENAPRVFEIAANGSAIYGIAYDTQAVRDQNIYTSDLISVAYMSPLSSYYKLSWEKIVSEADQTTYYANVQTRTAMPVNGSVRYVVGLTANSRCSAMASSTKVQYYKTNSGVWSTTDATKVPNIVLHTNDGTMQARLGTLEGNELYAVYGTRFVDNQTDKTFSVQTYKDKAGEKTLLCGMFTLSGAALSTSGGAKLRFDNAINAADYANFKAVYGDNFKVGMLIVKTADLRGATAITEESLKAASVSYQKVESTLLYREGDFAVLGSAISVGSTDYDTSYTAIGYVEVKIGTETVVFMSPSTAASSVEHLASVALADVKNEADSVYCNPVAGGKYSRYTAAEQQVLKGYLGK